MTHRDANIGAFAGQTLHDLATQESRTSEHSDAVVGHVRLPLQTSRLTMSRCPRRRIGGSGCLTTASTAAAGGELTASRAGSSPA